MNKFLIPLLAITISTPVGNIAAPAVVSEARTMHSLVLQYDGLDVTATFRNTMLFVTVTDITVKLYMSYTYTTDIMQMQLKTFAISTSLTFNQSLTATATPISDAYWYAYATYTSNDGTTHSMETEVAYYAVTDA